MRSLLAVLVSSVLATQVFAADRALLDDEDVWKLYTDVQVTVMEVNDSTAPFIGLGVGGILNDTFDIGLAGYALAHDISVADNPDIDVRAIGDYWTAGATAGYTFAPASLLHVRVGIFGGYGELHTHPDVGPEDSGSFLVVEPSGTVYVNITETVELGASVGYRAVDGSDIEGVSDGDLSDIIWGVNLRVTEF